ncbi:hypothetical protein Aph01nite_43520 [Acrocarpospora phusangensis]|uniref:Uncharacterized protein n=1 Tax=Acrocarpospora phusangensis TaxID=1070424 RepID=A0A919UPS9_9ACTN|nr:hypothetical protein Aph01nite_43520 [Acrocarpospora phusangensis]
MDARTAESESVGLSRCGKLGSRIPLYGARDWAAPIPLGAAQSSQRRVHMDDWLSRTPARVRPNDRNLRATDTHSRFYVRIRQRRRLCAESLLHLPVQNILPNHSGDGIQGIRYIEGRLGIRDCLSLNWGVPAMGNIVA